MRACVHCHASVRACVRCHACVRACVLACVRANIMIQIYAHQNITANSLNGFDYNII